MYVCIDFLFNSLLPASDQEESERDRRLEKKVTALEELLASKLAQFLDSSFSYSLRQLPSSAKTHLYKGSTDTPTTVVAVEIDRQPKQATSSSTASSSSLVAADSKPHPLKGGWIIQDYLTYDW